MRTGIWAAGSAAAGTLLAAAALLIAFAIWGQDEPDPTQCAAAGQLRAGETDLGEGDYVFRTASGQTAVLHFPSVEIFVHLHPVFLRLKAGRYLVETEGSLFFECRPATGIGESGKTIARRNPAPTISFDRPGILPPGEEGTMKTTNTGGLRTGP